MPKDRSKRTIVHNASVKPNKRQFAVQDNAVEKVEIGAAPDVSANDLLRLTNSSDPTNLKKKDKQQLKHEAFLQRLELTQNPYSKSHQRRMKRKAREQIGQGLDDIHDALNSLSKEAADSAEGSEDAQEVATVSKVKPGQIGEGKAATLSRAQRKRALEVERLRHPLILSNPQFQSNPFQTIRTHAQNSLVKHVSS